MNTTSAHRKYKATKQRPHVTEIYHFGHTWLKSITQKYPIPVDPIPDILSQTGRVYTRHPTYEMVGYGGSQNTHPTQKVVGCRTLLKTHLKIVLCTPLMLIMIRG